MAVNVVVVVESVVAVDVVGFTVVVAVVGTVVGAMVFEDVGVAGVVLPVNIYI